MNKLFKRAACLAVTAAMTLSSSGALACTGYYVGKQASASGHTIIKIIFLKITIYSLFVY